MTTAWLVGGAQWLPILNSDEVQFGIPTNLLARCAFEECSWRPEVIDGTVPSSAGALGILQLMPQFFASVRVPIPFTLADTMAQIKESAQLLSAMHQRFGDWQVAVAAYNWGGGNVHHEWAMDADEYILADMPPQTQKYVREVFADVPLPGALLT
jgi:membrane-bound lytic murein transglycosylase D